MGQLREMIAAENWDAAEAIAAEEWSKIASDEPFDLDLDEAKAVLKMVADKCGNTTEVLENIDKNLNKAVQTRIIIEHIREMIMPLRFSMAS